MLLRVLIVWNWTRVTLALWNAARWKPTYQSSNLVSNYDGYPEGEPNTELAVDGDKRHFLARQSCSHTLPNDDPTWWMVDLQGLYLVKRIMITNRSECCSDRLKQFRIEFFDSDPRLLPGFAHVKGRTCYVHGTSYLGGGDHYFDCAEGTKGRFGLVAFQEGYQEPLTMCEFEALVETVESRSIPYKRITGVKATVNPMLTLNVADPLSCAVECNNRRDQELCTAFNWNQERRECWLLSNNPYFQVSQSADVDWDLYQVDQVRF